MTTDIQSIYDRLKREDRFDRVSIANKNTIRLAMEDDHEILLRLTSAEYYLEFKRAGKRYCAYRGSLDSLCADMIAYMNGSKPLPSAEEYNKQNAFVAFMLLSALALVGVSFLIVDYSSLTSSGVKALITGIVVVTWAIEIGIKIAVNKLRK